MSKIGFYDKSSLQDQIEKQSLQQQLDMANDDLKLITEDRDRWKERAIAAEKKLAEQSS